MHSSDKTARSEICDRALRLFADNGADNVSLRQVAAAAEVSPSLVVHHFGGKAGLREAVNDRSLAVFRRFAESVGASGRHGADAALDDFLPGRLLAFLSADSPVPAHLCGLLLSDDQAGRQIFRRWHQLKLARLEAADGAARAVRGAEDRARRAAWLTVNEIAVLLLRDQIRALLGGDPLGPEEAARWAELSTDAGRDAPGAAGRGTCPGERR
ncbi:TetR/AcrR family transcriptional regulator [Actinomadura roseirufa]|uniref:TetR/AcrR family transcriptional regulator n=1 Tax=Actinomadura roseirufa TaxID=2094049 RepID=UPI00104184D2|nr:TetR/AcrR family transcriptional regulator [Actinomadura roseirufa]